MTWESFGYICRRTEQECQGRSAIAGSIAKWETDPALGFYGGPVRAGSLPRRILEQLRASQEGPATDALRTYAALEFAHTLGEPVTLRRAVIYLAYIALVFYFMSFIYLWRVMPAFNSTFAMLQGQPGHLAVLYQQVWPAVVLVISVLLLASMVSAWYLRRLFRFQNNLLDSLPLRFLTFPGIRETYRNLHRVLLFPVSGAPSSDIEKHLAAVQAAGLPLATEMQQLLGVQTRRLLRLCEFQMRCLLTLTAVLIIAAIGFFLVGAYSPIFFLGETI